MGNLNIQYIMYGFHKMYVIEIYKTINKKWIVEVSPCDDYGKIISDPVVRQEFHFWLAADWFFDKQYKEFNNYINGRY